MLEPWSSALRGSPVRPSARTRPGQGPNAVPSSLPFVRALSCSPLLFETSPSLSILSLPFPSASSMTSSVPKPMASLWAGSSSSHPADLIRASDLYRRSLTCSIVDQLCLRSPDWLAARARLIDRLIARSSSYLLTYLYSVYSVEYSRESFTLQTAPQRAQRRLSSALKPQAPSRTPLVFDQPLDDS